MNQKMLTDPNENVSGGNVNTLRPQPLGLYIHIPYCIHKCGYCDFNSHLIDQGEMGAYVDALLVEMDHYAQSHSSDREVQTLFLGGGTPTTLPISQLVRILESAEKNFCFASNSEITFEANPATIGQNQLKSLRQAGYNRISVGVQSFNKTELTLLDRAHGVEEIHCTIDRARGAGFDNLSLDLIFAIPGQTLERWEDNLRLALDKNPQHLSTYNLTIEPETAFWKLQSRGKLTMPNEEHQLALYRRTLEVLESAGLRHYEISNFARPGRECRHNITYWQNGNSLGFGAGASSFLDGTRHKNINLPARYIKEINKQRTAVESQESLKPRRAMGESLMLGLRLLEGISIQQFEERFQTSFDQAFGDIVSSLQKKDLVTIEQNRLRLSEKGLFLADSVILEFIA